MPHVDSTRTRPSLFAIRVLWCPVILLALLGVAAALGRALFLTDFVTRAEPFRQHLFDALRLDDPHMLQRAEEVARFDHRFAAHPFLTLLHVVPGAIFLVLAPLQFSSRVRNGYVEFHRWSGRVLILLAFAAGSSALYFGLLVPYGGPSEAIAIALFGGLFLAAISRAFLAIRRRRVACHREWMIRAFATAIGISTVRVVGAVLDVSLTPAGFRPQAVFVLSLWTGWTLTLGGAELWIRYTRSRVGSQVAHRRDVRSQTRSA
jgi:uncharacterized membrane protein